MDEYINCLYKQFLAANGGKVSKNSKINYNEFGYWLAKNRLLLKEYSDYLQYLNVYYEDFETAEIGKGRYDTLATEDMSIISPYGNTLDCSNAKFIIKNNLPYAYTDGIIIELSQKNFLTHNPYKDFEIAEWYKLHNNDRSISIGMFGLISDKNYKAKIALLQNLAQKMCDDYTIDFDTDNDRYFCALNSRSYVKRLVKTRHQ